MSSGSKSHSDECPSKVWEMTKASDKDEDCDVSELQKMKKNDMTSIYYVGMRLRGSDGKLRQVMSFVNDPLTGVRVPQMKLIPKRVKIGAGRVVKRKPMKAMRAMRKAMRAMKKK